MDFINPLLSAPGCQIFLKAGRFRHRFDNWHAQSRDLIFKMPIACLSRKWWPCNGVKVCLVTRDHCRCLGWARMTSALSRRRRTFDSGPGEHSWKYVCTEKENEEFTMAFRGQVRGALLKRFVSGCTEGSPLDYLIMFEHPYVYENEIYRSDLVMTTRRHTVGDWSGNLTMHVIFLTDSIFVAVFFNSWQWHPVAGSSTPDWLSCTGAEASYECWRYSHSSRQFSQCRKPTFAGFLRHYSRRLQSFESDYNKNKFPSTSSIRASEFQRATHIQ